MQRINNVELSSHHKRLSLFKQRWTDQQCVGRKSACLRHTRKYYKNERLHLSGKKAFQNLGKVMLWNKIRNGRGPDEIVWYYYITKVA